MLEDEDGFARDGAREVISPSRRRRRVPPSAASVWPDELAARDRPAGSCSCAFCTSSRSTAPTCAMLSTRDEERLRRSRRSVESLDRVRESPLTIPVSIVAPVYNEEPIVVPRPFVSRVDYPEYEVIVVNDGSTDGTLDALSDDVRARAARALLPAAFDTGRSAASTAAARSAARRGRQGERRQGRLAQRGLNLARYRYVCGVDGDTILARRACSTACASRSPTRSASSGSPATSRSAAGPRRRWDATASRTASTVDRCSPSSTSTTCGRSSTTGSAGRG